MPARKRVKNHELRIKGKSKAGFTLIELMVAIAIIAILAAVGLVVYSTAQKSGRISKRAQDLAAFKTALELYKSSTGFYPSSAVANTYACITTPLAVLVPNYMPALPADPLDAGNTSGTYCYEYVSNSTTAATEYKLRTKSGLYSSEMNSAAFGQQPNLIDPARDGTQDCIVSGTYQGWAIYVGGNATCLL